MIEVKVPELAESISEGTIAQWLVKVGDIIQKGDYIVELETDKVNVEVSADSEGVIKEILKEEGDIVEVDEVIALLVEEIEKNVKEVKDDPKAAEHSKVEEAAQKEETNTKSKELQRPLASPAVRKLARELNVDLNKVKTQDLLGRIRQEDVRAHVNQSTVKAKDEAVQRDNEEESKKVQQSVNDSSESDKPVERVKMSRRRQTIAKRLVEVQRTAAMLTTFNEVDMTAIMGVRKRRNEAFLKQHEVKIGFMSFFTKAVVGALKQFPELNAEIQGDEMILKKFYDIGIAVGTEGGLVVPVVRNADQLGFAGIEKEIARLAEKARSNKLTMNELQGGTFTITNGGIYGSMMSTPILNSPQVGILGMHSIQWRAVAVDQKTIENRPMMYIALSYDHRIVDGKEAVSFLAKVKQLLEDPESLLLEG
ncbi:2-oxoglutarate dehydrogenase complex dihydrolipoyllysine-residue succinyltransferase [Bacillus taeanensis]|uniref:Dihydrolipoyllysine-residue succinyltransferase component of 2-oxoglutarate dehydrogenase complex n=1 Tax=Bacillus taeanensis TaxID=273032 RepID=A0A366XNG7_9BACI|nr:2-oxoglutarate dehydrogenase complex dihydrolipoyllysine-residue succinyltransferase [Bacillus taeanensis]RBW67276.1 dihydrolipoamide succinyltransferase [Bacillus taeanensis]